MSGSITRALKAAETNKRLYGEDHYKRVGALGGKAKVPKGFAINRELARKAGAKGGAISRRGKAKANA